MSHRDCKQTVKQKIEILISVSTNYTRFFSLSVFLLKIDPTCRLHSHNPKNTDFKTRTLTMNFPIVKFLSEQTTKYFFFRLT